MIRPRAAVFALAASFSVYLLPLVGAHGAWLLAEALFQGEARKSPHWMASNVAVAVFTQSIAAAYFYWFFGKPGWRRGIPLFFAAPLMFLLLQWVYQIAIPSSFLEEPDLAKENVSWPVECMTPG